MLQGMQALMMAKGVSTIRSNSAFTAFPRRNQSMEHGSTYTPVQETGVGGCDSTYK